jgi:hypothetical protein
MRFIIIYLVAAWLFGFWPFEEGLITGPSSGCSYDEGYDDGYDGASQKCNTNAYREGFEDGDFEADCHWHRCVKSNHDKFKRLGCGSWSKMRC